MNLCLEANTHCPSYFVSVFQCIPSNELASEKLPEVVIKGINFICGLPDPPTLWCAKHTIPHPFKEIWPDRFFLLPTQVARYGSMVTIHVAR